MGTRGWTLSTLLGCCAWILHGLGAVTAVPVTTDGSFAVGTAFPMTTEDEWPRTAELVATAADAETFPPWTEMAPVTATSEYGPSVPALVNATKAPNTTQSPEGNSTAPNTATTAAAIPTQHPAVTPEAAHDEPEVTPDVPLGTTPVLEDVKEDISADLSAGTTSLHTTPPLAVTWVPQPTAGVTVLLSQGLTTAKGAVEEGGILPEATQSEASANSTGPRPDAGELLPTQQDGAVGGVEGINPEPEGETTPAGQESPLASDSGDPGDAINGEFSTASSTHLPPESPVMSGTVENPGKSSLLPGQALSPDTSLTPSNGGDGDGQGIPGMSSDTSGSALSPAASRAPVAPEETEDTATSLPAPGVPTEAQSDTNLPVSATVLPAGDVGAVDLASPSLQPNSWQTPTGEQPLVLPGALTFPTDTPSAPAPADPAPEAGASTLPEADGVAETPASPDLTSGPEAAVSPSLGESEPAGKPAGAPQEPDGLGTGLSSDSDAPSPAPFVPDGLAWPTAGTPGQAAEGVGDVAQAGDSGDAGPYEDTQSDMSPPALQPSVSPADNGELLTGGTEDLAHAELSPPSALGDGTATGTGGAPVLGQVSSPSSAPHSSAGVEPDLSGPEGPGDLPSESANAPGAVSPPLGSVAGPVSEAETPVSPDLSAAQGAPGSPSSGGSQPWGTAAGAPVGAGLPGAEGPDTDSTLAWDTPSSAVHEPVGPPSPGPGDQLGTNVGLPAAEGQGGSTAGPALEGAGSGIESEPSLGSTAESGIAAGLDQLPSAGSSSGVTSPSDVVAAPSVSGDDEEGPVSSAAPGPDSLSPASPDGETGPGFDLVQGAENAGDVAQAGNPESENPNMETNPSAASPEQDLTNTGELPAEETGDMAHAELSPPSAPGDGTATGTGGAPALGQVSSPSSAPHSSAGVEPDLSGPEGPGDLPSESANAPGAVSPPLGSVAGPVSEAETPVSPDLSAAQGAPGSPSSGGSQPWGTAAGAPVGAGLPGAEGPDTDSTLAWDTPSSVVHGPVGPPSPGPGDQLGTNVGLPAAEGQGGSTAGPALEGAGSGIESEPSLGSTAESGIAAGLDQLPSAGSSSGVTSPSDVVAAPSVSGGDEEGPVSSAAPGPDSLSPASPDGETGPGFDLVQGAENAGEVAQAGNPESENPNMETNPSAASPEQGELPGVGSSSGLVSPSGDVADSSVSGPSSLGALGGADSAAEGLQPSLGAGTGVLPAAGEGASEGAGDGGSTGQSQAPAGVGPAGSESLDGETGGVLQSASSSLSTEGSSSLGRTDEAADGTSLPGAAAAGGGLNAGLEAAGPQEASVSAPGTQSGANTELSDGKLSEVNVVEVPGGASVNGGPFPGASPVPVAPDNSGVSNGMTTSMAGSLPLPGHGPSSGLAPNGVPNSAPSTQTGSSPLLPGSPSGLSEEAGGTQSWSLEDEVASGMPAPVGEVSPPASISPNAAPVPPSAPQRGNSAEGVSASPGLSARELIVGSSAGGKGELGAAVPGGPALLLPLCQPGSPSGAADSPAPGEGSAVLHGTMTEQGDITHLLPSASGSGAHMETHSPAGGSPGLPDLPPSGITAGSPGAKTLGPGPAGGSSPAALQPFLGRELTPGLANRAPASSGSSFSGAFPGWGGSQGRSPATARPATSCSPALASPAPPAPLSRGREVLPRPGAATVTSHTPSPVVPAPPGVPAAAPALLPSPAVPAVPLYGYGPRENDQEYVERRVDFNSPLFKPETGFPFGKTLRTSLYFTDNGQIIFPASDNNILMYPNPPPRGFNGHEEVPMIAVFWDNADFSRGVGTTFYQEFSTLNTAKPPFVRDVEAKVRRYLRSSYSAAWTLKITWEKAPVHAARTDTQKTITYQAVLTTDGFRSYILMLYQDGGMQWDYTRLTSTNVLIGYTSGDGFYHNDDLTKRPPAAKYRPDQFRGYNTDLRGLWIYKLESRVGNNYRLKCLAWTGQQQEPRAWSQDLPTCPCSLQQGQQDPRFKSSRGGRWGARVSMLHSASPNQHGAGVRCLYDSQSQLIEGRQERYWRSSRQASPYRDQELKLYDWCCNRAGSAHLCARYSEKRPKIGCDGYQSPSMDSSEEAENDSDEQRDGEDK